jgi:hypothetical protein
MYYTYIYAYIYICNQVLRKYLFPLLLPGQHGINSWKKFKNYTSYEYGSSYEESSYEEMPNA